MSSQAVGVLLNNESFNYEGNFCDRGIENWEDMNGTVWYLLRILERNQSDLDEKPWN